MNKTVFFSDLDNTLIYSHRHDMPGEKIPAELLDGRVQSYMTELTFDFLRTADYFRLIPVTTRTVEQYSRIFVLGSKIPVDTALVCNGGVLLRNGISDADWYGDTMIIAESELPSVERAYRFLTETVDSSHVHFTEPFFVYAKCDEPQKIAEKLSFRSDICGDVNIYCDSRKIYCIAKSVTKGNAVVRLKKLLSIERCIAAGDSLPDVSMLRCADAAFFSGEIADKVSAASAYNVGHGVVSDKICGAIIELRNRGFFDDRGY